MGAADVAGCFNLSQRRALEPKVSPDSDNAPTLMLMDLIFESGYKAVSRLVEHKSDGHKLVDVRSPASKRAYFRCVLNSASIFKSGRESFSSGQSMVWYKLLLKCPARAVDGMGASDAKALLDAVQNGDEDAQPMPRARRAPRVPRNATKPSIEIAGDDDEAAELGPSPEGPSSKRPCASSSSKSSSASSSSSASASSSSSSSSDASDAEGTDDSPEFPETIAGQPVHVDRKRDGGLVRIGLRVCCDNPHHVNTVDCAKYRSVAVDFPAYGKRGVEFYLKTWLAKSRVLDARKHKTWIPQKRDIDAWLR